MSLRNKIQALFLVIVSLITINHTLAESGKAIPFISSSSIHGICPFGGVVSIYELIKTGGLVPQIHLSSLIIMGLVFLLALLIGPAFCGWVCPLGTLQEFVGKVGKKILGKKYNHFINKTWDTYMRYLRYGVLIWVVYVTAESSKLLFKSVDPYYAMYNFWTGEVATSAMVVLGLTIVGSLFVERPWCKYLCPYGALLGLFNLIRIIPLKRTEENCIDCKLCDEACPMNITLSNKSIIRDHQCISCMECTSENACPSKGALYFDIGSRIINSKIVAVVTIIIVVGGLYLFNGIFSDHPLNTSGGGGNLSGQSREERFFSGELTPDTIKGSFTISEVSKYYGIELSVLKEGFSIDGIDIEQLKLGDFHDVFEKYEYDGRDIGTSSMKLFVALYKDMSFEIEEPIYLTEKAVKILLEKEHLTQEQKDYLIEHTFVIN